MPFLPAADQCTAPLVETLELFFGRRPRNCAALPVGFLRFFVVHAKDLFIAAMDGKKPQPLTAGASYKKADWG